MPSQLVDGAAKVKRPLAATVANWLQGPQPRLGPPWDPTFGFLGCVASCPRGRAEKILRNALQILKNHCTLLRNPFTIAIFEKSM